MKPADKYEFYESFLRLMHDLDDKFKEEGRKIDEEMIDDIYDFLCDRMDGLWWEMTDEERNYVEDRLKMWHKHRGTFIRTDQKSP